MSKEVAVKKTSGLLRSEKVRFDFAPKTLQEAIELSKILADSDLVPAGYKGKPGNVLVAMNYGAEIGLSGIQAVQNLAVVNGKPSIYGDLGKALLLQAGCTIEESDVPETKKNGTARCKITRPDGRTAERTFSIEDAKAARLWGKTGSWTDYPYRQMGWRAFWFAARDLCSDILKGLRGLEEVEDYEVRNVTPAAPDEDLSPEVATVAAPPAPPAKTAALPPPASPENLFDNPNGEEVPTLVQETLLFNVGVQKLSAALVLVIDDNDSNYELKDMKLANEILVARADARRSGEMKAVLKLFYTEAAGKRTLTNFLIQK